MEYDIIDVVLVSLLSTLNIFHALCWCFLCLLRISKCLLGSKLIIVALTLQTFFKLRLHLRISRFFFFEVEHVNCGRQSQKHQIFKGRKRFYDLNATLDKAQKYSAWFWVKFHWSDQSATKYKIKNYLSRVLHKKVIHRKKCVSNK